MAWQDAAYAALSPETEDDPVVESADGALFLAVSDYYNGVRWIRAYLAGSGRPPCRRGFPRARAGRGGRVPALQRLLASTRTVSSTTDSRAGSPSRSAPRGWPTTTSSSD